MHYESIVKEISKKQIVLCAHLFDIYLFEKFTTQRKSVKMFPVSFHAYFIFVILSTLFALFSIDPIKIFASTKAKIVERLFFVH